MINLVKSDAEFKKALESNSAVVADFYADWCGPCKALSPKLEQLSQQHSSVVFLKVDVDQLQSLAEEYGVSAMPTIIVFKNGKVEKQIVGFNLDAITEAIRSVA